MPKPLRSSSPHAPSAFSFSPSSPGSSSMQAQFSPDPSTLASFSVTIISPMAPKSMNLYPQPSISPSSSFNRVAITHTHLPNHSRGPAPTIPASEHRNRREESQIYQPAMEVRCTRSPGDSAKYQSSSN
ncbi:hypothetical protein SLEP1_g53581 [Rubroshorea leprosula]|uniref:Uncharacterized protein n=1 Tax=Rubroshorea leprosula TaxID=152421 RepID=A0AAV5MAY4_9ROSI|nr:hypothetical protein SLEP1_g53581 [Rubroshorea leprosula]